MTTIKIFWKDGSCMERNFIYDYDAWHWLTKMRRTTSNLIKAVITFP
jgi:hypothetical protein